ncbi:hypothetical protein [Labrys wisconsinensis]|uniref:hypothetical protein n=1 Tax=Labrys wisconsinensis TaxID=425677 RepID=UPI0027D783AE|nr:hypothetical protein [Labrys wisconsinensis]
MSDQRQLSEDAYLERSPLVFDPWLTTNSRIIEVLGENLALTFDLNERRQRRRKARDNTNIERIIRAILTNLAFVVASGREPASVAVSLRSVKQKLSPRYDPKGFGQLTHVLETLSDVKRSATPVCTLRKSTQRGVASRVTAGDLFNVQTPSVWKPSWLRPEYFGRASGGEVIRLSRTVRDFVADTRETELVDYDDTEETVRFRGEMHRINHHLASAQMDLLADDTVRMGVFTHRELRRHFKLLQGETAPRFDLCGRLFGGWWQGLSSMDRMAIRIDGESIADLDFSSMFLRLAYVQAGLAPPAGDLYADVFGFAPGPKLREGAKKVVNAMFFRSTPLSRMPKEARDYFGPNASGAWIRSKILEAHTPIRHVFESGGGLGLMFTESQILVAALLRLVDAGVTALPMHDGLMVARSKADLTAKVMGDAAEAITGHRLPISLKSQPEVMAHIKA